MFQDFCFFTLSRPNQCNRRWNISIPLKWVKNRELSCVIRRSETLKLFWHVRFWNNLNSNRRVADITLSTLRVDASKKSEKGKHYEKWKPEKQKIKYLSIFKTFINSSFLGIEPAIHAIGVAFRSSGSAASSSSLFRRFRRVNMLTQTTTTSAAFRKMFTKTWTGFIDGIDPDGWWCWNGHACEPFLSKTHLCSWNSANIWRFG